MATPDNKGRVLDFDSKRPRGLRPRRVFSGPVVRSLDQIRALKRLAKIFPATKGPDPDPTTPPSAA